MNTLYKTYTPMIHHITKKYYGKSNHEYEDLYQEACLIFCETYQTYDPQKGTFSTYLWHCLNGKLKNYITKIHTQQNYEIQHNDIQNVIDDMSFHTDNTEEKIIVEEEVQLLPDNEKIVIDIIHNMTDTKITKQKIIIELKKKNWKTKQIYNTFNSISRLVNHENSTFI